MKTAMIASLAGLALAGSASATFVSYQVVKTSTTNSGIALDVYVLYARFDGATDTVLNAYNLALTAGSAGGNDAYGAFYHKDNTTSYTGVLQKGFGTWNPTATGSATANRPFDSYLTIGGFPTAANSSSADPSWNSGGSGLHAGGCCTFPGNGGSWNRPDICNNGVIGWFNGSPPNNQGRVGLAGNTATDVRLGQFVVDAGANAGTWTLTTAYNNGVAGSAVQFANGSFSLGGAVPAPGALALLGLAGFAGRRRR
jgi:MYXO-CTERM domain-containing protein